MFARIWPTGLLSHPGNGRVRAVRAPDSWRERKSLKISLKARTKLIKDDPKLVTKIMKTPLVDPPHRREKRDIIERTAVASFFGLTHEIWECIRWQYPICLKIFDF
jgi:hypothetical protein